MNLEEFRALASAQDNYEQSQKFINVYFEDPNFLVSIIQLFNDPKVQCDLQLMQLVEIVMYRNIKNKWCDKGFYSEEMKSAIFQHLNELVYCLPVQIRPTVFDCIDMIIKSDQLEHLQHTEQTIQKFLQQDSIENVNTALMILNAWAEVLRLPLKNQEAPGNMFAHTIFPIFLEYIKNIQNFNLSNCKPLSLICEIFKNLFPSLHDALLLDFCKEIIGILLSLLSYQSNEDDCILMKSSIYALFREFIKFLKKENNSRYNYLYWFTQNYLIQVWESFFVCFNSISSQEGNLIEKLKNEIVLAAGCMIYKEAISKVLCENSELIIKFYEQVLIPCSILSKSGLIDFDENPTQYLLFALNEEEKLTDGFLRHSCSYFALGLKNIVNVIPMFWNYILTTQDPKVQEACIFLISSSNPERFFDRNMSEQLFELIKSAQYKPLIAAILDLMSKIKKINFEHMFSLANNILFQTDCPVFKLLSIRLLEKVFSTAPPEGFDPSGLIQFTLTLSQELYHSSTGQLLTILSQVYPEQILPYSLELIQNIASQFYETMRYDEDDENTAACALIESISNIIDFQTIEVFSSIFENLYNFVTSNIIQYQNSAIIEPLIDLCWEICKKFDKTPPEQLFQLIPFFNKLIDESDIFMYLLAELSRIYIYLIQHIKNPEIINQVICIMNKLISEESQEGLVLTSALFILSAIIQSHGEQYINLVEIGFNILSRSDIDIDENLIISCIYLFSSALYLNKEIEIPSEIIQIWIDQTYDSISNDINLPPLRDLKINFIGLTILLLQTKSNEIFDLAALLLKKISILSQPQEPNINEEEEEDFYEPLQSDIIPMSGCSFPLESVNIHKLFKDVLQHLSITDLSDELISILNSQ